MPESDDNERVDGLTGTADITTGLWRGRAEVPRGLGDPLNMDRPEHHSTDRQMSGDGKWPTVQPPETERSVFDQASIGFVSRSTLWRLVRNGAGLTELCDAILSRSLKS